MLRREEEYIKAAEIFYRERVQVVLLLSLDSWFPLTAMDITVEGTHTWFLRRKLGSGSVIG